MSKYKEGDLVNITFKGIILDNYPGANESETFYNVFIPETNNASQFISDRLKKRQTEGD